MSEPKHTPGPWIYYNARATVNATPVYTLTSLARNPASSHDGIWLADIRSGREGDDVVPFEGGRNACLIASAPELLAICRKIFDAKADPLTVPLIAELRSAIAKATGETL